MHKPLNEIFNSCILLEIVKGKEKLREQKAFIDFIFVSIHRIKKKKEINFIFEELSSTTLDICFVFICITFVEIRKEKKK